jgi:neutral ceramidase
MAHVNSGRAGACTMNITPDATASWGGTALRRDEAEDSDLLAHAAVFTDGNEIGAIVSTDLTMIARRYFLEIRELAAVRSGVPAENITIAANHVHVAPSVAPGWRYLQNDGPDPIYVEMLADCVATAVSKAKEQMVPALVATGQAPTSGITFNRRYLRPDGTVEMVFSNSRDPSFPAAGPTDNELGYILFESPDNAPIALITSFSAHNHVVGGSPVPGRPESSVFHRDFGGRFGDVVRDRLGVPVPTVYLAGAGGNTAWQDPDKPAPIDGPAAAWSIGSELASALLDHLPTAPRKEITGLQFASESIEIPDRPMSESHFCDDMCRGDAVEIQDVDRARWTAERNAVASRGDQTSCMVEVGAIAFSNVAISTNPAELFVEFGLEIKERSPFEVTLVSELSNGYCGYVPTEHAFDEGGYETHRSVFSSRLAKNAGLLITEKSVEMLNQCANA